MYFVSLETTLWGLPRFSNFLALMLHCAALEPGREDSSRPAHITLRNAAFQRAESRYMQRMGRAYLLEMFRWFRADAHGGPCSAVPAHSQHLAPSTPIPAYAAFLGHMGGVWLRGSGVWANRQGSNYLHEPRGTVVPDGLFHFGSRPHHPSQTVILYIELIIDVCPILYHVSYIISYNP